MALTCQRLQERLTQAPDPMTDLLAQLPQRLGASGAKPREYLRWIQANVGAAIRMIPTSDILFFRVDAVEQVSRNLRGQQVVHVKARPERLEVSRSFNHRFRQM